jgi:beta-ureidopropionase / N-carbamoyl-L-amino-acid hydrolase
MNRRTFHKTLLHGVSAAFVFPHDIVRLVQPPLSINGARLNSQLAELAEFGKNPQGGVSRVAYSEADLQGRAYVVQLMRAAQLNPSVDFAGNIIGRRAGAENLKPLMIGSHIDSVPEGGNYDGTVGSLGAIEVARTIAEQRVTMRHPLEVIVFANEEGGKTGSRALSGELIPRDLELTTASKRTIREGTRFIGGDAEKLDAVKRAPGSIAANLELHIEQGGTLEQKRIAIGEVEGIVGIRWWNVTVTGFANHAGTTPMDQRQDALLAAARFIDAVNRIVRSAPGRQVGTVGRIEAQPGARNVIPGKVITSLELRDLDEAKIAMLFERISTEANQIGEATNTKFAFEPTYQSPAAVMDERLRSAIVESARELGLSTMPLPSGAGHDAQSIALLAPTAMIFIPSVNGISHSPKEYSTPGDIVNGVNVLLQTLLRVDRLVI